jgi:hypothetical protein
MKLFNDAECLSEARIRLNERLPLPDALDRYGR